MSPDGSKLAFAKFDDRNVQTIKLPIYGEPGQLTSQYTRILDLKYPKVGAALFFAKTHSMIVSF